MDSSDTRRPAAKQRLDVALVERGLVGSREKAQALILAGKVTIGGQRAAKPGQPVAAHAALAVEEPPRYVSRGGLKLEAALALFGLAVQDRVCFDVGASTGGFTDCLLQHGARRVHTIDTGAGQIDWKLRGDPRVVLHENCNARYVTRADIGESAHLIAFDVSFISVTLLFPALVPLLEPEGSLVVLVKPQFEAGRDQVGAKGVVRDPELHALVCRRVAASLEGLGFATRIAESPITGRKGNREFLLHAQRDGRAKL